MPLALPLPFAGEDLSRACEREGKGEEGDISKGRKKSGGGFSLIRVNSILIRPNDGTNDGSKSDMQSQKVLNSPRQL